MIYYLNNIMRLKYKYRRILYIYHDISVSYLFYSLVRQKRFNYIKLFVRQNTKAEIISAISCTRYRVSISLQILIRPLVGIMNIFNLRYITRGENKYQWVDKRGCPTQVFHGRLVKRSYLSPRRRGPQL